MCDRAARTACAGARLRDRHCLWKQVKCVKYGTSEPKNYCRMCYWKRQQN